MTLQIIMGIQIVSTNALIHVWAVAIRWKVGRAEVLPENKKTGEGANIYTSYVPIPIGTL